MEGNKINNRIIENNGVHDNKIKNVKSAHKKILIKQENLDEYFESDDTELVSTNSENIEESDVGDVTDNDSKKKYLCTFNGCNAQFLRPSRLLRHVRQHTGERPYKCNFKDCEKAYTNSSHLKRHLETHSNMKQIYTCPHCPKKISFLHNLKRHCERMHSNDNNRMVCKDCGKRFKKNHSFQEHLAAHSNSSMTYKCECCDLSFTNHAKLTRHLKSHSNSGFKCKICQIKFDHREDYYVHLKSIHPNDHICNICNKSFIRKSYLEKHRLTHSEDMFTCHYENCYRIYYFKRNLDTHIRTSHLGRKFVCDMCKVQYTSKRRLSLHISKIHLGCDLEPKKEVKPKIRKPRKNKGIPTKSMISKLIGVKFPHNFEKRILNRKSLINLDMTVDD